MTKRLAALSLAFVLCLALLPAPAGAEVLPGWTSKVDYENADPNRYAIEIDLTNQIITVYEYAVGGTVVLQSLCTTGSAEFPTGAGTFRMGELKERFGYFVAFGQYAQYWSQVVRGVYIHSVMYNSTKLTSMSKSAYSDLGKNVSHGCVRVLPDVAKWIYYNCPPGTICKIVKNQKNEALAAALKKSMPSYSKYAQPSDDKAAPRVVPALIRYDGTPLRTGFSASRDTTVATLKAGAKVLLLQIGPEWCKVETERGELGYVKSQYIVAYPDAADTCVTSYVAKSSTYAYASMSTSAKKLARVPSGASVAVERRADEYWWYGTYEGAAGYFRVRYVEQRTSYVYPSSDAAGSAVPPPAGTSGGGSSSSGSGGTSHSGGLG